MASNFPKPAELPEGGEGGGSGRIRLRPGGVGGPNEIPPIELSSSFRNLLHEVFSLRNRVHALESDMLASRLGGGFARAVGGPNELPEGGEGGGGGIIVRPPKEIAELPAFDRSVAAITGLVERFAALEKKVTDSFQALSTRIDALKR